MKKEQGLTLIETLIYSGIVSGFVVLALVITYQMIDFRDDLNNARELYENQRFLSQKIDWVLSSVSAINSPAIGATSASVSVNKISYGSNPLVLDLSAGAARLSIAGAAAIALTNGYVTVSGLTFENLSLSGHSFIRAKATLANGLSSTTIDNMILIK